MGSVVNLEVKSKRHIVEQTIWAVQRDAAALGVLANEGSAFFREEIIELRQIAHDLLGIADQAQANIEKGSR